MLKYSVGEVMDRLSILILKKERDLGGEYDNEYLEFQTEGHSILFCSIFRDAIFAGLCMLYQINKAIWDLENDIREGREGIIGLEETGRRAILIRDHNAARVQVKNFLNNITGTGYKERKTTW